MVAHKLMATPVTEVRVFKCKSCPMLLALQQLWVLCLNCLWFLLSIQNSTPPIQKTSLHQITDKAHEFSTSPPFDKILLLLIEHTLEDWDKHLVLVKVIDCILYKLNDLVCPYVHKILVIIEPLLINKEYYACVEECKSYSTCLKSSWSCPHDLNHASWYPSCWWMHP